MKTFALVTINTTPPDPPDTLTAAAVEALFAKLAPVQLVRLYLKDPNDTPQRSQMRPLQ